MFQQLQEFVDAVSDYKNAIEDYDGEKHTNSDIEIAKLAIANIILKSLDIPLSPPHFDDIAPGLRRY